IGPSESARCPDLKGIGAKLSREFLYESLTDPQAFVYKDYRHGGVPKEYPATMPAINKDPIGLSKNEILAIIAFLQQMSGEPISISPAELEIPGQASPPAPVKAAEAASVAVAQAH
ncbi:MAG: cytochrome c, partial [Nitrospira sp.]|nr:cytochrome c [Nitrospira sp.]